MTEAQEINAGIEWLDNHAPGWHNVIDLVLLDMEDCNLCVLGQTFGGAVPGMPDVDDFAAHRQWALERGFWPRINDRSGWVRVTDAWRREIYLKQQSSETS